MYKSKTLFAAVLTAIALGAAAIFSSACNSSISQKSSEINFASYNMLYSPDIKSPKSYGGAWGLRRGLIAGIIRENNFDIVASQELTKEQVLDFQNVLGADYAFAEARLKGIEEYDLNTVLKGRKIPKHDIVELSMHNAIWYKPARFELLDKGHFYLSATPEKFSFGFDKLDGQHRRCVWAKFRDKTSDAEFFVFNIHTNSMDYPQDSEREKSARVIIEMISKIAADKPFVLCGDFNAFESLESVKAYIKDGRFFDTKTYSLTPPRGHNTYSQFGKYDSDPDYGRIDYIFTSKDFTPLDYRIIGGKRNGAYPSDHYPVCSRLKLEPLN